MSTLRPEIASPIGAALGYGLALLLADLPWWVHLLVFVGYAVNITYAVNRKGWWVDVTDMEPTIATWTVRSTTSIRRMRPMSDLASRVAAAAWTLAWLLTLGHAGRLPWYRIDTAAPELPDAPKGGTGAVRRPPPAYFGDLTIVS